MTTFQYPKNNAFGLLASQLASGGTVMTLANGHTLATASFPYPVSIENEILSVTGTSSGTLAFSVTRAQESTSAAAHGTSVAVENRVTAKYLSDIHTAINTLETSSPSGTHIPWTAWTPTLTASGLMTWTATTIYLARYCQIGKVVYFQTCIFGTVGGTLDYALMFTLPVAPKYTNDNYIGGGCLVISNGVNLAGSWRYISGYIQCLKFDCGLYAAGVGGANVNGHYEVA